MTNDSLETVGKLFKLQVVNDIHPSIISMVKTGQCSLLKLKTMYCNHETYHQRYMGLKCTLGQRNFLLISLKVFREIESLGNEKSFPNLTNYIGNTI